jgi:nicotinamide-nucleotide adenylyltransferase
MKKFKTGVFIGRFQPFHFGHLEAIKQGLEVCEKLIVVIGSTNRNFSNDNPLTASERKEVLNLVLEEEKVKVEIIELGDEADNLEWIRNLIKLTGKFDVMITNNSLVKVLCEYERVKVWQPKLKVRNSWQGKVIRQKMIERQKWEKLVPKYLVKLLREFKIEERLKKLEVKDY